MTREAIEYFKFHRKIFCEDHLKICPKDSIAYQATLKEKEFYDMAIKALEQEPRWIPLTKRPMTDEETEHYFEYTDMRIDDTYTILDCPLPNDGQEVLVSWGGNVGIDVFIQDNEGCYFEGVDIDEVDAWMPLPLAYERGEEV